MSVAASLSCTYNVHKTEHLHEGVLLHGPPVRYWAYPFERMNLEVTDSIHRKDCAYIKLLC